MADIVREERVRRVIEPMLAGTGLNGIPVGMELKVWRDGAPDPLAEGLKQLDGYLAGLGLDTGWLVVFDRRTGQPAAGERTAATETLSPQGRPIKVIRA